MEVVEWKFVMIGALVVVKWSACSPSKRRKWAKRGRERHIFKCQWLYLLPNKNCKLCQSVIDLPLTLSLWKIIRLLYNERQVTKTCLIAFSNGIFGRATLKGLKFFCVTIKDRIEQIDQRMNAYLRGSITVWLTSCLFCLPFLLSTILLVWSNPNQSNKSTSIQWYFPLS